MQQVQEWQQEEVGCVVKDVEQKPRLHHLMVINHQANPNVYCRMDYLFTLKIK
jgi:hypothetical protein